MHRVPPGVDEAAYVKAAWLSALASGSEQVGAPDPPRSRPVPGHHAGRVQRGDAGGIAGGQDAEIANAAANQLKHTLLVFDAFYDVQTLHEKGNVPAATAVLESWAAAEWFTEKPAVPESVTVTIFKVSGETNTDDLSPAQDAWSRPDIPLHAVAMLKNARDGIAPDKDGEIGPLQQMQELQAKGFPLAYTGDVVGTGSSRKSATNSVLYYMGQDIPYTPNVKGGGLCLGGKIAPIFFNTMEDSGALPIELDVSNLEMGDVVTVYPQEGVVKRHDSGETVATFELKTPIILDEVRAGGRIPLIIGRGITTKAREALGRSTDLSDVFVVPGGGSTQEQPDGYTLAQKMVGQACGVPGVPPQQYCEPRMTTVGSQDTTGPMTRDELRSLACLGFSADLVMQSFCHTAAYPKPVDVVTHHTLPDFIRTRGGVSFETRRRHHPLLVEPHAAARHGRDGRRFPHALSHWHLAFPPAAGWSPSRPPRASCRWTCPRACWCAFTATCSPASRLRDLVQAIPYTALQMGLLTTEKKGKKNVFSGRILEIEGLPDLKCEQAFELSDASAERSAAGCTIALNEEPIMEYLNSNVVMLKWMINEGYGDARTIERRIARMEEWLANPVLMKADPKAQYAQVIEIDLNELKEPVLALPNDPDASALLSEVQGSKIDEVFIGSCMTNIGHFRAAGKLLAQNNAKGKTLPTKLWVAPPTKMDEAQLMEEGYYSTFGVAGARTEMPGCSLCMGNQARVAPGCTVISTSTRNFPNRLGQGANVYLGSAELAAITSIEGELPTVEKYMEYMQQVNATAADTYRYLNFDQLPDFVEKASHVEISAEMKAAAHKLQTAE